MTDLQNVQPQVVASSERWLVVSKPAGWLTIPGRVAPGTTVPVLVEWAKENFGAVWVVHRLDLETSGVILFARTSQDHREASVWFQERKMKKEYHCIASGVPTAPLFKVKEPVAGVASLTQVEVKESYLEGFLAKIMPQTGRRHQIRIHLASQDFPIWGDSIYRGPKKISFERTTMEIRRVALHSVSLALPTGEVFEAPYPEDFYSWLTRLRKEGKSVSFG